MLQDLNESQLGTKEYWEAHYSMEIENFNEFGEKGEIWFGQVSAQKMVQWVIQHVEKSAMIGDLGCGNGHLVLSLEESGFENLKGLDYSEKSIQLCRNIAKNSKIQFIALDILDKRQTSKMDKFDLLMDKGTFDAISLAKIYFQSTGNTVNSPPNQYVDAVCEMLKPEGLLVITSCNWTQGELVQRFNSKFQLKSEIAHPVFKFGGVQGQAVTTLIFQKLK